MSLLTDLTSESFTFFHELDFLKMEPLLESTGFYFKQTDDIDTKSI